MDDDDESMMIGIDFGTFKIDTGICGEEEGVVTLKTPEEFCWEYLDHDLAAQRAFESGRCLLFQCTRHNLILTHKHTHTHTQGMRFSSNYTRLEAKREEIGITNNGVIMSIPSFQRANVYAKVLEIGYETLNFDKFLYMDQLYLAMYVYRNIYKEILTQTPRVGKTGTQPEERTVSLYMLDIDLHL